MGQKFMAQPREPWIWLGLLLALGTLLWSKQGYQIAYMSQVMGPLYSLDKHLGA